VRRCCTASTTPLTLSINSNSATAATTTPKIQDGAGVGATAGVPASLAAGAALETVVFAAAWSPDDFCVVCVVDEVGTEADEVDMEGLAEVI